MDSFLETLCCSNDGESQEEYREKLYEVISACLCMVYEFHHTYSRTAMAMYRLLQQTERNGNISVVFEALWHFMEAIHGKRRNVLLPSDVFDFIGALHDHRTDPTAFFAICMCYAHTDDWRQWPSVLSKPAPPPTEETPTHVPESSVYTAPMANYPSMTSRRRCNHQERPLVVLHHHTRSRGPLPTK